MISYVTGEAPDASQVAALYAAALLRRPIHDLPRLTRMIASSNVRVCARDGQRLVGFLRGLTDGAYDGFVADLAVHPDYQKQGIGVELLRLATSPHPDVQWVLLASPLARDYYAHVGWKKVETGWLLPRSGWSAGSYEDFAREHAGLRARS